MIGGPTLGLFMMAMTNPWSNRVVRTVTISNSETHVLFLPINVKQLHTKLKYI